MPRRVGPLLVFGLALATALRGQDAAAFRKELETALAAHPFFSKNEFLVEDAHAPFLFFVQRPAKPDPKYIQLVVNSYLPFLSELARIYEAEYRKPLELQRSPAMPAFAIAVLASEGNYHDYGTAVASRALHQMRAHYDPRLRLCVTYQIAYGDRDHWEERQALLHEFGHALQHAHSSTDEMTKPTWFNEGFADYRASGSHVASSLREPVLQEGHVRAVAFGYGNRAGNPFMLPIADLVVPESYAQVVAAAKKRVGGEIAPAYALGLFYAQAEMVVRFLHEGGAGKHRAGFLRYLAAVQAGKSGLDTFRTAFGATTDQAMAAIEQEWRQWLTEILRRRNARFPDLAAGGAAPAVPVALPPPAAFDAATLAWRAEETALRFSGARRLCRDGQYEAAAQLLPATPTDLQPPQQALLQRELPRIAALATLRDAVLADLAGKPATLSVRVADADWKGKVVRVESDGFVLLVGKEERKAPLSAMTPEVLLREGARLKRFQGAQRWLEVWLRWLTGQTRASMKVMFELGYPSIVELKGDLDTDLDDAYGREAEGLSQLQRLPLPDDAAAAKAALQEMRAIVHRHGRQPLLAARKDAIEALARALAERAFTIEDAQAQSVRGRTTPAADGAVKVVYTEPAAVPDLDFTFVADAKESVYFPGNLAYEGPTQITAGDGHWRILGDGSLRWALPLSGRQEIEVEFLFTSEPKILLLLCREELSNIHVSPDGRVSILDQVTEIDDDIGALGMLYAEKWYKLRVVHDGQKRVETFLDGKRVAEVTNVGTRIRGEIRLLVHSSNPIQLRNLSIQGRLDAIDPLPVRERFVLGVLQQLWP